MKPAAIESWTGPQGVTAAFAAQDVAQILLLEMAHLGLIAPRDLSVVGIAPGKGRTLAERAPLSAIVTDGRKMGAAVGQAALTLLGGGDLPPLNGVVDAAFEPGGTIVPVRGA